MTAHTKLAVSALGTILCSSAAVGIMAAEKLPEPVFQGAHYECKVFDRYRGDSGFMNLKRDGKSLFTGSRVYASIKGEEGKEIGVWEKANPQYNWEKNVLTSRKEVVVRNDETAEPVAEITRKITFSESEITCEIVVKNLKDIAFSKQWKVFCDYLAIPTASLVGMRADGTLLDGQPLSTVIPVKFDSKKWGFNKNMSQITLTDPSGMKIVITAGPQCQLLLNNYGGKNSELRISPIIKPIELNQKAGQETSFNYTIKFEQAE